MERGQQIQMGSGKYLQYTLVMLVGTMVLVLLAYYSLIRWGGRETYKHVTAVGYSCVVFGWMTVRSVKQPTLVPHSFSLLGEYHISLPGSFVPFASLIFTSVVAPEASFIGHLSGIAMGYMVAWDPQ